MFGISSIVHNGSIWFSENFQDKQIDFIQEQLCRIYWISFKDIGKALNLKNSYLSLRQSFLKHKNDIDKFSQYFGIDYRAPKVSALSVEGIEFYGSIASSPLAKQFCQWVKDTLTQREEALKKSIEETQRKIEIENSKPLTRPASRAILITDEQTKKEKPMQTTGILQKQFHETLIDYIQDDNGYFWITAEQLGTALGYAQPRKAITKIINRHKDLLENLITGTKLGSITGDHVTTIINEHGADIICMKSNTLKAKEYIKWAYKVISDYRHGRLQYANPGIEPEFIRELYARMGPYETNQYLRKALNLKDTPANIVKDLLLALEFTKYDFNQLKRKYRYTQDYQFYIDINSGAFKEKERLAADLGVTVQDIWG